jgi:hypothetical protein
MKHLYVCCVLLLSVSCQTKPSEQNATVDTAQAPPDQNLAQEVVPQQQSFIYTYPATFKLTDETVSYSEFLQPGSVIFKDSTYESQEVLRIELLTPVRIISNSSTLQPQSGPICEQYFWYEVMLPDETVGWVYGAGLLKNLENQSLVGEKFILFGTEYTLYYLQDSGVGASNSDGLTGCNEYVIPYFFNERENTYHFIKVPNSTVKENNLFISTYLNWLSFLSNEGGGITIQSIGYDEENDSVLLKLSVGYQDGGSAAKMYLLEGGGHFELLSFEETPEDGDENLN